MNLRTLADELLAERLLSLTQLLEITKTIVIFRYYSKKKVEVENEKRRRAANNIKIPITWCIYIKKLAQNKGPFDTKEEAEDWFKKRNPSVKYNALLNAFYKDSDFVAKATRIEDLAKVTPVK
jgi:hypothetical protein